MKSQLGQFYLCSFYFFFFQKNKKLSRPVKDLDDVRSQMASLGEIREGSIKIDMTIQPIEESYAMLNKYNIFFNDGNAERVDSLSYGWKKLNTQAHEVQDHLLNIQPEFKADLLAGVEKFIKDQTEFVGDYDIKLVFPFYIKPYSWQLVFIAP